MADTPTIEALHKRWIEVFNSHDLDAHVALYTEDAMMSRQPRPMSILRMGIRRCPIA